MNVIFTQLFDEEISGKLGITRKYVSQVLENPDTQTNFTFDNLELNFYLKYINLTKQEHYLLVCTRKEGGNSIIDLAFKILPSLVNDLRTLDPIMVLQEFVQRFGLVIRIGHQLNKFIIEETVLADVIPEPVKIVEIINPLNHSFLQSVYLRVENKNVIKCAIAYCIDTEKYKEWLSKNGEKQITSPFIAEFAPQLRGQYTVNDLIASGLVGIVAAISGVN